MMQDGHFDVLCCSDVSRELLSGQTAGARYFMKHLEQLNVNGELRHC